MLNMLGDNVTTQFVMLTFDNLSIQHVKVEGTTYTDLTVENYSNGTAITENQIVEKLEVKKSYTNVSLKNINIIIPYISKKQIETLRSNKQGGQSFDITIPNLKNYYLPKFQIVFADANDANSGYIRFPEYIFSNVVMDNLL